jgi:hypothetical protein
VGEQPDWWQPPADAPKTVRKLSTIPSRCLGVVLASIAATSATAQVPKECRANYGEVDLCAAARTISDDIAPTLPVRLAGDMSLTTITATGRRIIMSATWGLTDGQFREQLTIRHITAEQFAAHLDRLTKRLACTSKPEAAFVTLGGEIEYHYVASDGYVIAAPVITTCR